MMDGTCVICGRIIVDECRACKARCRLCGLWIYRDEMTEGHCHDCTKEVESL
jgi:hypothetical protein